MALLAVRDIRKSFGASEILRGVSFELQERERCGLVGRNGTGKTTLLRIIAGLDRPDSGEVTVSRGAVTGYLSQTPNLVSERTLYEEMKACFSDLVELRGELRRLESEISGYSRGDSGGEMPPQVSELLDTYGRLSELFERRGGYEYEARIRKVLAGLGFTEARFDQRIDTMSGGELTRAQLARILLQQPDVLILDEPTNHLDIATVEWLETWLSNYPGSVLVVSHDRYFLDRIAGSILELSEGVVTRYKGNYSQYAEVRRHREESLRKAYELQQAYIRKQKDLIRNSDASERSKRQARSREKRLERLELVQKPVSEPQLKLRFDSGGRSGEIVVRVRGISKSFGGKTLFSDLEFTIRRGERVALVGPNGSGKTTLLRLLLGKERPDSGEIYIGPSVTTAYYDQRQEYLNPEHTLFEEILETRRMTNNEIRNWLGRYMFSGDDVFKKVGDLSGGERSRLAVARMCLTDANFLILDEPTNHLDLDSVEALEDGLSGYDGTMLLVSHDRFFLNKLVNRVLELSDGRLGDYSGNYDQFFEAKQRQQQADDEAQQQGPGRGGSRREGRSRVSGARAVSGARTAGGRNGSGESRVLRDYVPKRSVSEIEKEIEVVENRLEELKEMLNDPEICREYDRVSGLGLEYAENERKLEALYEEWENAIQ